MILVSAHLIIYFESFFTPYLEVDAFHVDNDNNNRPLLMSREARARYNKPGAKRHHMVSGTLAPLYSFLVEVGL